MTSRWKFRFFYRLSVCKRRDFRRSYRFRFKTDFRRFVLGKRYTKYLRSEKSLRVGVVIALSFVSLGSGRKWMGGSLFFYLFFCGVVVAFAFFSSAGRCFLRWFAGRGRVFCCEGCFFIRGLGSSGFFFSFVINSMYVKV